MTEGIVSAKDAARKIEEQQRDLTETIHKLIGLRNEKYNGRLVLSFEDGRIVDHVLQI